MDDWRVSFQNTSKVFDRYLTYNLKRRIFSQHAIIILVKYNVKKILKMKRILTNGNIIQFFHLFVIINTRPRHIFSSIIGNIGGDRFGRGGFFSVRRRSAVLFDFFRACGQIVFHRRRYEGFFFFRWWTLIRSIFIVEWSGNRIGFGGRRSGGRVVFCKYTQKWVNRLEKWLMPGRLSLQC